MPAHPQVVVVGSLMQDITFACTDFPTSGQTVMARMSVGQGGKGSNQAIACGRLGIPTLFVGAAGRDPFAEKVRDFYRREKIGCRLRLKAAASGTAVILLNRLGQNEIVIEPGANAHLSPADIPAALFRHARVVVAQLEASYAATAYALRTARAAGAITLLNPAPMRAEFRPALLKHVDILIPNETEFVALVRHLPGFQSGKFDKAALHALPQERLHTLCRQFKVPTLIVTMGEKGCFVSGEDGHHFVPAHDGIKVVDTTGAGDAFCGGLAAGLVRFSGDIVAAVRLGTAVAALSTTKLGAAYAMPTKVELKRFYPSFERCK